MLTPTRTARFVARAAILVCSLTLAGYLVFEAERPATAPALAEPESVQAAPASAATDADASLPTSLEAPKVADEIVIAPAEGAQAEPPAFLYSSKTLSLRAEPYPPVLVFPPPDVFPPPEVAAQLDATPKVEAPVFLPSSKIRLQSGLLRPVLTPAEPVEKP